MRIRHMGLIAAAMTAFAMPAAAQDTDLFPFFKKVCLDNDADPAKSLAAATALGLKGDPDKTVMRDGQALTALIGEVGGNGYVYVFGFSDASPPARPVLTCSMTTGGNDESAARALEAWVPGAIPSSDDERTYIAYRQTAKGRIALDMNDEAAGEAAIAAGELGVLAIDTRDGSTSIVLARTGARR